MGPRGKYSHSTVYLCEYQNEHFHIDSNTGLSGGLAISADETFLAVAFSDVSDFCIWNIHTEQLIKQVDCEKEHSIVLVPHCLAFTPDNMLIISSPNTVKIWDPATCVFVEDFKIADEYARIGLSSDGSKLYSSVGQFSPAPIPDSI